MSATGALRAMYIPKNIILNSSAAVSSVCMFPTPKFRLMIYSAIMQENADAYGRDRSIGGIPWVKDVAEINPSKQVASLEVALGVV